MLNFHYEIHLELKKRKFHCNDIKIIQNKVEFITWTNLQIVKENVERIQKHYKAFRTWENYLGNYKEQEKFLTILTNEPWIGSEIHYVKLLSDLGKESELCMPYSCDDQIISMKTIKVVQILTLEEIVI